MYRSPIGVGIVGTGRISDLHALEYLQNPDARIVMLCDSDVGRARARAEAWQLDDVKVTGDMDELLANPAVDLVEILLPHSLHHDAAMAAMAAGKAISLQKPMSTTIADAERLVGCVNGYDRPFRLFENFLFYPPVVKARQLIGLGAVGDPLSIRIKSNPGRSATAWEVPASALEWRQEREKAGGGPLVFDDGHHKFAIAWSFMGTPEEVHAFIGRTDRGDGLYYDAQSIVSFRFPGNRIGNLEVVYSPDLEIDTRHYAQDDRIEITGTSGVIWINCGHGRLGDPPPLAVHSAGVMTEYRDLESGWEQSFILATRHYIDVLLNGGKPVLTAREGLEVLRFAAAAERSAAANATVSYEA